MSGSTKVPAGFWSMGATLKQVPQAGSSKSGDLLAQAQARLKAGDAGKALALAEQAVKAADNINTRLVLATVCLVARELQRAETNYMEVLRRQPGHFKALLGLGQLKLNTGQPEDSIKLLEMAIGQEPGSVDARHLLARSYGQGGRYEDAISLFVHLVNEAPRDPDIWSGYGRALAKQGRVDEAIKAYHKALELKPGDDAIHQGLGAAYLSIGEVEKSEQHLQNATRIKPERGAPLTGLAKLKRLSPETLEEAKQQMSSLPASDPKRRAFLIAIAAAAERGGNYDEAFAAVSESMSLAAAQSRTKYIPSLLETVADGLIPLIGALQRHSFVTSLRPVFIIGMPRSGSTLIEQILARHPSVFAAGEWTEMNRVSEAMMRMGKPFPDGLPRLTADDAAELRGIYYSKLPESESGKALLTDKLLGNAFYLPLIELIFPEATIVRCRRHPMDIVWSIMTQNFGSNVPYAHKLEDICHHMLLQHRILSAWAERGTLPTRDVFYEELVESFEAEARSLVEFTGLPWNDACLSPQESRRAVLTSSAGQVHQPVSKSAVGRWKPFASQLDYAVQALKPLIELHEAELARRGIAYS